MNFESGFKMTLPTLLLASLIAMFYGTFYHLLRGGSFWRLLLYLGLSAFGFVMGHLVGLWRSWIFIPVGTMNLGLSSIGSVLFLILGDWLSRFEVGQESKV
jgi:hypothetical protein